MPSGEYQQDGFEIARAYVKVGPDLSDFPGELQELQELQVGNALTGPQADQAQADGIYLEKTVVSIEEIRLLRYGLPPRPPLPPGGTMLASGFPDPDPGLTVRLPDEMAGRMPEQIRAVDGEWREVFPGLQAKMTKAESTTDFRGVTAGLLAEVVFRLTPEHTAGNAGA